MPKIAVLLLFLIYSLNCEQIESKLEGKPFYELSQTSVNLLDEAAKTQFILSSKDSWVGLELTSPAKISKIGFIHLSSDPKNYLLGFFKEQMIKLFSMLFLYI